VSDWDELVSVPRESFVAARDALAKRVRAEGDAERAAAVKKMRKPTVAEWLAAKVMRDQPLAIEALRNATRRVATAQEDAVVKGEREQLRTAIDEHRAALAGVEAAVDLVISDAGGGEAQRLEVIRAVEAQVTETAASGMFGLRDDLELEGVPQRAKPPKRDPAAERRTAKARDAIAAAEARVERAREDLAAAEQALVATRARYEADL
jgi:hypothetical protein